VPFLPFLDPGSGNRDEHPGSYSKSLETIFGLKIVKFFDADPGSGIFFILESGIRDGKIRIRDGKIRIRDPGCYPISATTGHIVIFLYCCSFSMSEEYTLLSQVYVGGPLDLYSDALCELYYNKIQNLHKCLHTGTGTPRKQPRTEISEINITPLPGNIFKTHEFLIAFFAIYLSSAIFKNKYTGFRMI
jgi:hypothetical protein